MTEKNRRLIWRLVALVYLICLAVLCFGKFQSGTKLPTEIWGIPADKVVHFFMFLPAPIVFFYSLYKSNGKPLHFALFMVLTYVVVLLLAVGIEVGQSFTDYRSFEVLDIVADVLGLSLGTLFIVIVRSAKSKW